MCESAIRGVSPEELDGYAVNISPANIDAMNRLALGMDIARMVRQSRVLTITPDISLQAQRAADWVDSGLAADVAQFTERQQP